MKVTKKSQNINTKEVDYEFDIIVSATIMHCLSLSNKKIIISYYLIMFYCFRLIPAFKQAIPINLGSE